VRPAVAAERRAGRLALDDRDQRIAPITDAKEHIAHPRAPLLTVLGKQGKLPLGKHARPGCHGPTLFPPRLPVSAERVLAASSGIGAAGMSVTGQKAGAEGILETSVPGVFAVGDVRSGSVKRCATAVGEGAMVVRFVHERFPADVVEATPAGS
jgi:hypothetical protein